MRDRVHRKKYTAAKQSSRPLANGSKIFSKLRLNWGTWVDERRRSRREDCRLTFLDLGGWGERSDAATLALLGFPRDTASRRREAWEARTEYNLIAFFPHLGHESLARIDHAREPMAMRARCQHPRSQISNQRARTRERTGRRIRGNGTYRTLMSLNSPKDLRTCFPEMPIEQSPNVSNATVS